MGGPARRTLPTCPREANTKRRPPWRQQRGCCWRARSGEDAITQAASFPSLPLATPLGLAPAPPLATPPSQTSGLPRSPAFPPRPFPHREAAAAAATSSSFHSRPSRRRSCQADASFLVALPGYRDTRKHRPPETGHGRRRRSGRRRQETAGWLAG